MSVYNTNLYNTNLYNTNLYNTNLYNTELYSIQYCIVYTCILHKPSCINTNAFFSGLKCLVDLRTMLTITDFFMRTASTAPLPKKRRCIPGGKKHRKCSLVADEASQSGSDHSGASDDEWSDEERAKQEAFIADEPVKEKRLRLPKLTAAEKIISDDELENLRDTCVSLATTRPAQKKTKKGYADAGDFLDQTEEDFDFIASSDSEDLQALEREASVVIHGYVSKKGVRTKSSPKKKEPGAARKEPAAAKKQQAEAETKKQQAEAETKKQQAETQKKQEPSKFCPGTGLSIGTVRVRELNPNRQVASIFKVGQRQQPAKPSQQQQPGKRCEPGLVVNSVTKEVHYRHPDGRMSPRPGAL